MYLAGFETHESRCDAVNGGGSVGCVADALALVPLPFPPEPVKKDVIDLTDPERFRACVGRSFDLRLGLEPLGFVLDVGWPLEGDTTVGRLVLSLPLSVCRIVSCWYSSHSSSTGGW